MVYMTFLLSLDIEVKKSKNSNFLHIWFHVFFSILTKYPGQKSIAKKNYTPFCSSFNSASNHICDIISKRSHGAIAKLEYCPFNEIKRNFIFIFGNFFLEFFSLFKLSHIPIDRVWLALQNGIYDISSQSRYWSQKVNILYFLTQFKFFPQYLAEMSVWKDECQNRNGIIL
jgi:hypothetical protein